MDRERKELDCTHEPELHAWPSSCTVPASGDPSESAGEGEGAGGDESAGWFTGRRLTPEN